MSVLSTSSMRSVAAERQDMMVSDFYDAESSGSGSGVYGSSGSGDQEGDNEDGELPIEEETPSVTPSVTLPPASNAETICPKGQEEMSVEGVVGIFCVPYGAGCSGGRKDGKCPGRQTGLPHGSYCGRVVTGVYGCKPYFPWSDKDNTDPDGIGGDNEDGSIAGSLGGTNEEGSVDGSLGGSPTKPPSTKPTSKPTVKPTTGKPSDKPTGKPSGKPSTSKPPPGPDRNPPGENEDGSIDGGSTGGENEEGSIDGSTGGENEEGSIDGGSTGGENEEGSIDGSTGGENEEGSMDGSLDLGEDEDGVTDGSGSA